MSKEREEEKTDMKTEGKQSLNQSRCLLGLNLS